MAKWTDILFKQNEDGGGKPEPVTNTPVQRDSSPTPFPKLNIPILGQPSQATQQVPPSPPVSTGVDVETSEEKLVDPHLEKVVRLVLDRVHTLAGTSYKQFNAVRERMQRKMQQGQELDLGLVCAAINTSGKDLASEITIMEKGLQTAELEVGNEIDTEERNAISGLESEINSLESTVSTRQTQLASVEQTLQALRAEQMNDQRELAQKQGELRQQQATFTASRQRLRAARTRVAQDLASQKRTFLGL